MLEGQGVVEYLSKKEFETFLLIYAAHVDFDFSDSEKEFILANSDPRTYKNMLDLFSNCGDYTCLKKILHHKEVYYKDKPEQERIFELLTSIFKIDGDYSRIEKSFIEFFKKIIHTSWT